MLRKAWWSALLSSKGRTIRVWTMVAQRYRACGARHLYQHLHAMCPRLELQCIGDSRQLGR
eukprot:3246445-Amphidinium_carterae.2